MFTVIKYKENHVTTQKLIYSLTELTISFGRKQITFDESKQSRNQISPKKEKKNKENENRRKKKYKKEVIIIENAMDLLLFIIQFSTSKSFTWI